MTTTFIDGQTPAINAAWLNGVDGAVQNFVGRKVVVLGDSLSSQNSLLTASWPRLFENMMNSCGAPVTVHNLAVDAYTFYRAMGGSGGTSYLPYGSGTKTMAQECVSLAPDIILIMLGINDFLTNVGGAGLDGRGTTSTVNGDIVALTTYLNGQLPNAFIYYISEVCLDKDNFNSETYCTSLTNQNVIPGLMNPYPLAGFSGLTAAVTSNMITQFQQWYTFDNDVLANIAFPTYPLTGYIEVKYWRIARLGCMVAGGSGIHPTALGAYLIAAYVRNTLITSGIWPGAGDPDSGLAIDNPDNLFTSTLTLVGSGTSAYYTTTAAAPYSGYVQWTDQQLGISSQQLNPDLWYQPDLPDPWLWVVLTNAQSFTGGASPATVVFNLINPANPGYDPYGMYNVSTGVVTIPKSGLWKIDSCMKFNSTVTGQACNIYIYVNTTVYADGVLGYNSAVSIPVGSSISGTFKLTAGQTVQILAFLTGTATADVGSSTGQYQPCWLTMTRIHA